MHHTEHLETVCLQGLEWISTKQLNAIKHQNQKHETDVDSTKVRLNLKAEYLDRATQIVIQKGMTQL